MNRVKSSLNETFIGKGKILETDSSKLPAGVLCRVRYPICLIDKKNKNNRIYRKQVWESVLKNEEVSGKMKDRTLFGNQEHPVESQLKLNKDDTSHIVSNMYIGENGVVYADFDLLPTEAGRFIDVLLEAGCNVGVSTRAEGELEEKIEEASGDKYYEVVAESYQFITIDFTGDPSTVGTYPENVQRNVVNRVRSEFESKKLESGVAIALLESVGTPAAKELAKKIKEDAKPANAGGAKGDAVGEVKPLEKEVKPKEVKGEKQTPASKEQEKELTPDPKGSQKEEASVVGEPGDKITHLQDKEGEDHKKPKEASASDPVQKAEEAKIKESSYTDFIAEYGKEIKNHLRTARQIAAELKKEMEGKSEDEYTTAVIAKMKPIMRPSGECIYDNEVKDLIDGLLSGSTYDIDDVAKVALDISNRHGTEMRQVVNALDDVFPSRMDTDESKKVKEAEVPTKPEAKAPAVAATPDASQAVDPVQKLRNALEVMLKDPKISAWLQANDPMAFKQAQEALAGGSSDQVRMVCKNGMFGMEVKENFDEMVAYFKEEFKKMPAKKQCKLRLSLSEAVSPKEIRSSIKQTRIEQAILEVKFDRLVEMYSILREQYGNDMVNATSKVQRETKAKIELADKAVAEAKKIFDIQMSDIKATHEASLQSVTEGNTSIVEETKRLAKEEYDSKISSLTKEYEEKLASKDSELSVLKESHKQELLKKYFETKVAVTGLASHISRNASTLLERCVSEEDVDKVIDELRDAVRENVANPPVTGVSVAPSIPPAQQKMVARVSTLMESMQ